MSHPLGSLFPLESFISFVGSIKKKKWALWKVAWPGWVFRGRCLWGGLCAQEKQPNYEAKASDVVVEMDF